jgi:hypothetical protein
MLRILMVTIAFGMVIFFVAAAQVMVRRFSGIPRSALKDSADREALEDVQARLGELDQLNQRMGELEERVDFAERLLAGKRDEQRLGPAQDAR